MTASILDLGRCVARAAVHSDVDRAIARAELVRQVRDRREALRELNARHLAELTDARMRLGIAELALDEFEHEGRAAR